MPPKNDRIQVAPNPALRAVIDQTQDLTNSPGLGPTIALMLSMHVDLMRAEARRVPLTEGQASALAEIVGGPLVTPGVGALLIGEVMDAFDLAAGSVSSYGAHHGIDEAALLTKLRGIGPSADLALRFALARWWAMPAEDRDYRAAGLRIVSDGPPDLADAVTQVRE